MYKDIKATAYFLIIAASLIFCITAPFIEWLYLGQHKWYIIMGQLAAAALLVYESKKEKSESFDRIEEIWEKVKSILP